MMAKSEIVKKNIGMGMVRMGVSRERVRLAMRCCERTCRDKLNNPARMTLQELIDVCDLLKVKPEDVFRPTKIGGDGA